jgi:predicted PurR-regulated permease PerM
MASPKGLAQVTRRCCTLAAATSIPAALNLVWAPAYRPGAAIAYASPRETVRLKPQTVRSVAVVVLFAACAWLLHGLVAPIVWAALIAIATWPLHERLRTRLGPRGAALSAVVLTSAIVLFLLLPFGYGLYRGLRELPHLLRFWSSSAEAGLSAPAWLGALPGVGDWALRQWDETVGEPGALQGYMRSLLGVDFERGRVMVLVFAHHAMSLFFCVVVLFFLYLGGDVLAAQIDAVLARYVGPPGERARALALRSVRGAINGLVFVGFGVAVFATVLYAAAGVPHPFAWGLLTGLLGMVPFGATLVVAGVVMYFIANMAFVTALWLGAVGATAIFVADHFIRPYFMSGASKLPLVLALLGIVGGLETFGLLGLFLGPTLLALMVAAWHELAAPAGEPGTKA